MSTTIIPRFPDTVPVSFYDQDYFSGVTSNYQGGYTYERFGGLFQAFADCLITSYPQAHSFLDLGCASGFLVRALREREVLAWGIDCSQYAITQADAATRPFLFQGNLETIPFPSVDIVVASEVLEHLTYAQLRAMLPRLASQTMCGLLATIPGPEMLNGLAWEEAQREPTHVTLQGRAWWTDLFRITGWRVGVHEVLARQLFQNHPLFLVAGWNPFCAGSRDEC
jgi:SAM-dependent methyltransferase